MTVRTDRAEDWLFAQIDRESTEGILPEKLQELRLRREFSLNGKPPGVFPPEGYPRSLAEVDGI